MQGQEDAPQADGAGFPELNELGMKLEMLRIQRGIAKQHLARHAGTSRQQLWRVMTGKSELTVQLRERLAQALGVPAGELVHASEQSSEIVAAAQRASATVASHAPASGPLAASHAPASGPLAASHADAMPPRLDVYLSDPRHLVATLATLPTGDDGFHLKRQLLNAVEDLALARSVVLSSAFFETRRRVFAREL